MITLIWILVGMQVLGAVLSVALIGKERKPITSSSAAINAFATICFVAAAVMATVQR